MKHYEKIKRAGIGTKRFTANYKQSFIGLSKREAIEILKNDYEHPITEIFYVETSHGIPEAIHVSYGKMALIFDKDTRRIKEVW